MQLPWSGWHDWLWSGAMLVGSVLLALIAHWILFVAATRFAQRTGSSIDDSIIRHTRRPTRIILPLLAVFLVLPVLPLPQFLRQPIGHLLALAMIAVLGWSVIALTEIVTDIASTKYRMDVPDNLEARRVRTQLQLLRRVTTVVVSIVALSVMLMTFPSVRHLGVSLFASAGIAGLVVGMAARPTISNLIGGLQIALTEPIRLDDVVIVEGEWGRVEEIGTTYVVVRIWDLRRLVVPLSYFIEQPFQNWTRVTADLLGTVFVYADYNVPVERVRSELHSILEASGLWDGKVWGLQVTDTNERTMQLRALMSASDSSQAWDLRCHVREKLVGFLQREYPDSLPVTRAELRTVETD
ncbi:MAG: mechanosensitive ion channel [Gemmatimonadales bacterium]|jgi:small-conductance mechanosensitive channel